MAAAYLENHEATILAEYAFPTMTVMIIGILGIHVTGRSMDFRTWHKHGRENSRAEQDGDE